MLGERIYDRGLELIVIWNGEADRQQTCPSLLEDYPRGSTLQPLVVDRVRIRPRKTIKTATEHRVIRRGKP